ncbi:MAG: hypothetical protein ACTSXK_08920 [Promethearchaeota archaeon]
MDEEVCHELKEPIGKKIIKYLYKTRYADTQLDLINPGLFYFFS